MKGKALSLLIMSFGSMYGMDFFSRWVREVSSPQDCIDSPDAAALGRLLQRGRWDSLRNRYDFKDGDCDYFQSLLDRAKQREKAAQSESDQNLSWRIEGVSPQCTVGTAALLTVAYACVPTEDCLYWSTKAHVLKHGLLVGLALSSAAWCASRVPRFTPLKKVNLQELDRIQEQLRSLKISCENDEAGDTPAPSAPLHDQ